MAHQIPTTEPETIRAGDLVTWTRNEADYPPADWTLSYALVRDGSRISITATDNGDGTHLVSEASGTTSTWSAGYYNWQAIVVNSPEVYVVANGVVEILVQYSVSSEGYDGRSHAKRVLDALNDMIEGKALAADQLSYSIGGRSLTRLSPEELLSWRKQYAQEYASELSGMREASGSGGSGRHIRTRFRA